MRQSGCGCRLPQPGQLTIRDELLGYHNNKKKKKRKIDRQIEEEQERGKKKKKGK